MPGCQEEDSIPRTEALEDRAVFFLPSSDGVDAFCEEAGTSWRQILGLLVFRVDERFAFLGQASLQLFQAVPFSLDPATLRRDPMGLRDTPPAVSDGSSQLVEQKNSTTTGRAEMLPGLGWANCRGDWRPRRKRPVERSIWRDQDFCTYASAKIRDSYGKSRN